MDDLERFAVVCLQQPSSLDCGLAVIASALSSTATEMQLIRGIDDVASGLSDRYQLDVGRSLSHVSASEFCQFLFNKQGFQGVQADYYSPANSLLDQVLERRRANPITLSILGIEIGRRCGFEFVGIGMPGHFLLAEPGNSISFYDPFVSGRELSMVQVHELFESVHGAQQRFESSYLLPTQPRLILLRVLNNLQAAYTLSGDRQKLAQVAKLQSVIPGFAIEALGRLAPLLTADGKFSEAAEVHDRLCIENPAQAEGHQRAAQQLRARLN